MTVILKKFQPRDRRLLLKFDRNFVIFAVTFLFMTVICRKWQSRDYNLLKIVLNGIVKIFHNCSTKEMVELGRIFLWFILMKLFIDTIQEIFVF